MDFVIERKGALLPIEVKVSGQVSSRDARGIASFREEYGKRVVGGLVLYTGSESIWLSQGILAVPWWRVA